MQMSRKSDGTESEITYGTCKWATLVDTRFGGLVCEGFFSFLVFCFAFILRSVVRSLRSKRNGRFSIL